MKTLIDEDDSSAARSLWDNNDTRITGRITYVEARAALAAAFRNGRFPALAYELAKRRLANRIAEMTVVDVTEHIAGAAGDLAEAHRLRGYDAVHLACAIAVGFPDLVMASWDADLRRASGEAGIQLFPG